MDFLGLGGRPPLRFLRLAWSFLKYSEPRFAISLPPFRPRATAAGSFFFAKIPERKYVRIMHHSIESPYAFPRGF
jgi:hypothetical protein